MCWWWWWRVVSDVETETETHTSRELPVSRIHRPTRNLSGFPAFLYFRDIYFSVFDPIEIFRCFVVCCCCCCATKRARVSE